MFKSEPPLSRDFAASFTRLPNKVSLTKPHPPLAWNPVAGSPGNCNSHFSSERAIFPSLLCSNFLFCLQASLWFLNHKLFFVPIPFFQLLISFFFPHNFVCYWKQRTWSHHSSGHFHFQILHLSLSPPMHILRHLCFPHPLFDFSYYDFPCLHCYFLIAAEHSIGLLPHSLATVSPSQKQGSLSVLITNVPQTVGNSVWLVIGSQ